LHKSQRAASFQELSRDGHIEFRNALIKVLD
jgi:hypothetical protein